jgi:hypothetical protein
MSKTENNHKYLGTHVVPVQRGGFAKSEVISTVQGKTETITPLKTRGNTVPSSLATGSVWLRCSAEQPGVAPSETSTKV